MTPLAWLWVAGSTVAGGGLDLDTAVALALQNNEIPQIADARLTQALATRQRAYTQLFPTLSLAGTYTRRAIEVAPEIDGEVATIQALNAFSSEARISTRLFDARHIPDIQAAEDGVRAEAARREEQIRTLAFETATSFFTALVAGRNLRVTQRREALARATLDNVDARFRAGLVAKSVRNRTALDLATAEVSTVRSENAVKLARLSLAFLVGQSVEDRLVEPRAALKAPFESVEAALEARLDLQALEFEVERARHAAWVPWLGLVPSLLLNGSVRATNETGFQGRVFNGDVALTLEWVLFDGGARYAEAALLSAQRLEAELNRDAQRRRVALEVRSAAVNLETNLTATQKAKMRAQIAEENRQEVQARFDQGLASALEQTDAATAAFEAATALEEARFNTALAALALRRAMGVWPTDARPENGS